MRKIIMVYLWVSGISFLNNFCLTSALEEIVEEQKHKYNNELIHRTQAGYQLIPYIAAYVKKCIEEKQIKGVSPYLYPYPYHYLGWLGGLMVGYDNQTDEEHRRCSPFNALFERNGISCVRKHYIRKEIVASCIILINQDIEACNKGGNIDLCFILILEQLPQQFVL